MLTMFADGGIFNLVAMAIFAGGLGLMAIEYKLGERTRFPGLDDGLVVGVLATGFTGTWMGLRMALHATSQAGDKAQLLAMLGLAIALIPIIFTAVQSSILGLTSVAVQRSTSDGLRETIRPARALYGVTVGALATLVLSLGAGAGFCHVFFSELVSQGTVGAVLQTTSVQLWIDTACALGLTSMAMSAMMATMGLIGGLRALRA